MSVNNRNEANKQTDLYADQSDPPISPDMDELSQDELDSVAGGLQAHNLDAVAARNVAGATQNADRATAHNVDAAAARNDKPDRF